jgi:fluoride exporter
VPGNPQQTAFRGAVDADLHAAQRYQQLIRRQPWDVIGVVAAGGSFGAVARYGIGLAWPPPPGGFPWDIFVINTVGCALIGVLMVLITEVWSVHRLVRPLLGTGVLGGFTTFSTYAVGVDNLVASDAARTALLYMTVTPVAALVAVWAAVVATRTTMKGRPRHETHR